LSFPIVALNLFLGKASLVTYAGGGSETDPTEHGFKELGFKEGDWNYKDSYTGFFQSWGREMVWFQGKPFWAQLYGGGMAPEHQGDEGFAHKTFSFLKKVLSTGEKSKTFQPRGPTSFRDEEWEYMCEWQGNIQKFNGNEMIRYKGKVVFTHDFFGGLIVSK